jgi:RNA recognition motif-containing protein
VRAAAARKIGLNKKLYVGNLPFSSTEEDLKDLFARYGTVTSVKVITDRETGRPRGFAFVEMSEPSAATDAIKALDGTQLGGRALKVSEAQDKQRPSGGGGRGGFGRSQRY